MRNQLLDLDFAPGIKAKDVNYNFDIVKGWVDRERRRMGGWGLVEGFNTTADLNTFVVDVSDGLMVNKQGEEVQVSGTSFNVGAPEAIPVMEPAIDASADEKLIVPDDGVIVLKHRPYSESRLGYITFIPPEGQRPSEQEFYIKDVETGMRVPVLEIVDHVVYVDAGNWAGHAVCIQYFTTSSRIDSILLHKDGAYEYRKSIRSTSPSHVDLADLASADDSMLIGVVYWEVGDHITASFYSNHRTYRKVYVDEQNRLWLNGKIYKEAKFIYFEKPSDPQPNDLWYDKETNLLYIYRAYDGVVGWTPVNDCSTMTIREHKMFVPGDKDWPKDNKSFRFRQDETNLWFVPDQNSLEVRIDNAILMSDQFSEYVPGDAEKYTAKGRGFTLKDPLDRPTYVEVIVNQIVKSRPAQELFQRASIFLDEGHEYYNQLNVDQDFKTNQPYSIGQEQIEVWADGLKMVRGIDFIELTNDKRPATEQDKKSMSTHFRITKKLNPNQLVTYRVSRYVWSYDQLQELISDLRKDIDAVTADVQEMHKKNQVFQTNLTAQVDAVDKNTSAFMTSFGKPEQYMKKGDNIADSQISSNIKNKLVTGMVSEVIPTMEPVIKGLKDTDFIVVSYLDGTGIQPLIKDVEYVVSNQDDGVRIDLTASSRVSQDASLYVQAVMIGGR